MVDHSADEKAEFSLFAPSRNGTGWRASGTLDRIREWVNTMLRSENPGAQAKQTSGLVRWLGENRLPVGLTALWLMALGAYAIGYIDRLSVVSPAGSAVPTMDLMFFAFAVIGPIAMVWVVVSLINRTSALTESMAMQSESALALAATVGNLQESVDSLAAGTTGRLEKTLTTLEDRTAASVEALDDAIGAALDETRHTIRARGADIDQQLAATGTAIADVLTARIEVLDRTLEEASEKLDNAVIDSVILVNSTIRHRSEKFEAALDEQRKVFGERLDVQSDELSKALLKQAGDLKETQQKLSQRVDESLADSKARLDHALGQNLARQHAGFSKASEQFEEALKSVSDELARVLEERSQAIDTNLRNNSEELTRTLDQRSQAIDADLRKNHARLADAIDETAKTVDNDLKGLLENLRKALDETQGTITANPPASAEELARLLGRSARGYIRGEQVALTEGVKRLTALEEQAREMLLQLDRTSRLNPLMDRATTGTGGAATLDDGQPLAAVVGLPFEALPKSDASGALNWTAVVHALDTREAGVGIRHLVDGTRSDPQISAMLALRDVVRQGLVEDDLHVEDLAPEHSAAGVWSRFARGERGGEITTLAGIDDKVALTLTRARLRSNDAFREASLRFVAAYVALLGRAVAEIGTDPRLVEMAETTTGRIFMLMAPLTGALMPAPVALDHDEG